MFELAAPALGIICLLVLAACAYGLLIIALQAVGVLTSRMLGREATMDPSGADRRLIVASYLLAPLLLVARDLTDPFELPRIGVSLAIGAGISAVVAILHWLASRPSPPARLD